MMRDYLIKRIVISLIILWIVATLNFVIFQVVSPIRPENVILSPSMKPEVRQMLSNIYGLNDTLISRYFIYVKNMFSWNFGYSFQTLAPVAEEMSWRLPTTVLLLGSALILEILVGIPLGILAASRRGSKIDVFTIGSGLFTWGIPTFFIQLLFMLVFSYYFFISFGIKIFPERGLYSSPPPADPITFIADVAWHLAMPVLTLVVASFGSWALYTRSLLLDALTQDYIVTARAKGLSERTVLYRHAFRSTLPPVVTMMTLAIPGIIGGAVITEWIFTIPGIGRWYLNSMLAADYPVVQAVLFIYAVITIFANLVADILYGVLDPRVRVGMRR
jgi:peptide/nickel transport system permease protein